MVSVATKGRNRRFMYRAHARDVSCPLAANLEKFIRDHPLHQCQTEQRYKQIVWLTKHWNIIGDEIHRAYVMPRRAKTRGLNGQESGSQADYDRHSAVTIILAALRRLDRVKQPAASKQKVETRKGTTKAGNAVASKLRRWLRRK